MLGLGALAGLALWLSGCLARFRRVPGIESEAGETHTTSADEGMLYVGLLAPHASRLPTLEMR